jgi:hypothetical protein
MADKMAGKLQIYVDRFIVERCLPAAAGRGRPSRVLSDIAKGGDGAKSALREIFSSRLFAVPGLTDLTDMKDSFVQTTLRINDRVYRQAKAEAARVGITLTEFIERALESEIQRSANLSHEKDIQERNELMEALLRRTAGFRVGRKPTRQEMNAR